MLASQLFNRVIEDGRVACPSRAENGDLDVDVCAGCEWLHAIEQSKDVHYVRCSFHSLGGPPEYLLC